MESYSFLGSVTCLSGVIQFSKVIRFLGVICLPEVIGLLGMIQLPGVLWLSGHRLPGAICPPRVLWSPGATVHLRKRFRLLLGHSTAAVSWVSPPPQPSFPYLCGGQDICVWRTGGRAVVSSMRKGTEPTQARRLCSVSARDTGETSSGPQHGPYLLSLSRPGGFP